MKPKIFVAAIYLCAGMTVAGSGWGALWEKRYNFPPTHPLTFIAPLVLLVAAYVFWLQRSQIGKVGRALAVIPSLVAATALMAYLALVAIPEGMIQCPFIVEVTLVVIGLISFFLVCLGLLAKNRPAFVIVSLVAFFAWTCVVCVVARGELQHFFVSTAGLISPLIFAGAAILLFYCPRLGLATGAVAGLLAAWWLVSQEQSMAFRGGNSWIMLNLTDPHDSYEVSLLLAKLSILAAGLVAVACLISVTRLLPARWPLRSRPINQRTWPAFAGCIVILSVWYSVAARPYRVLYIVDEIEPDLNILHVEKRGLQFHELSVSVMYDSRIFVRRNDRRLFHYQFDELVGEGVIPEDVQRRARSLLQSPQLESINTLPAVPLRAWNAEGWYVRTPHGRVLAFTSAYQTVPTKAIVDIFNELEAVPTSKRQKRPMRDVCLGFCYDPLAGLGIMYVNQRCRTDDSGKTTCW